jgi:hypothetical protein
VLILLRCIKNEPGIMSKLASSLASIKSMKAETFVYTPPLRAYDAVRILVKADLEKIRPAVLGTVLRGLRRADPGGKILLLVNVPHDDAEADAYLQAKLRDIVIDNMQVIDIGHMAYRQYDNRLHQPTRHRTLPAPSLLGEVDCCISVAGSDRYLLDNLIDLSPAIAPNTVDYADLYFTLGLLFAGAVIDAGKQIVWGDDLLAVEEAANRITNKPPAPYLALLQEIRENAQITDSQQ